MLFTAKFGKQPGKVLVDPGATHNFISSEFVHKLRLTMSPNSGQVSCGGASTLSIQGCVDIQISLQQYFGIVRFYVLDLPDSAFDAVLGQNWLKKFDANIDYANQQVLLKNGSKVLTLKCVPNDSSPLLTALQMQEHFKDDSNKYFLMTLSSVDNADAESQGSQHSNPALQSLLDGYTAVFHEPPPGLPPDRGIGHTIYTGMAPPVSKMMYRLSPKEKECAETMVKGLLDKGWIKPSKSPYSSPILFVQKKDGSLRMCVNYRPLNKVTRKDRYPLPLISDLLDRLHGATVFSSLDLRSGYHQIKIASENVPKTAFITHKGLYEYLVQPFGLTNAPAVFQREMNKVFGHLPFVLIYLDDILIFSKTEEEHIQHLEQVLRLLKPNELYAKLSKCSFMQRETKFLGYVISQNGVHVDPEKIAVVQKWKQPCDIKELRSFLGLTNFFKRFIQGYSKLVALLIELTKPTKPFIMSPQCDAAFKDIKTALSSAPVLAMPDVSKPYELVCDASGFACGAVLLQQDCPIAFWSYKMLPAETRYHVGEQELLAVIKALEHWRCYLEGAEFTVITDHQPNVTLNDRAPEKLRRRQVRWQQFLSRFDFQWQWKQGKANVADPLSRNPALLNSIQSYSLHSPADDFLAEVSNGYDKDPHFKDNRQTRKLQFDGSFWRRKSAIVIPKVGSLRKQCIALHHDAPYAGHLGRDRTLHSISRHYW